jgi:tRNA1Val (adenine37-N6)-methyltransferase
MNNYFQFKQFTVYQNKCAMKVCTDACLFGSISPALTTRDLRVLDIGTGTGLLSLMYAQRHTDAMIDAVEIDPSAAEQATENFAASAWRDRLKVYNISIQEFKPAHSYDVIISNPPFFDNDLKSNDTKRNLALHSAALNLEELIASNDRLLKHDGCFGVLLPYHRTEYFQQLAAAKGFHLAQKILVKQSPQHSYFRSILFFSRKEIIAVEREIVIQETSRKYTPDFTALLKDYYLYL